MIDRAALRPLLLPLRAPWGALARLLGSAVRPEASPVPIPVRARDPRRPAPRR